MSEPLMHVVCAWCSKILQDGAKGAPVSHGVCDACAEMLLATLDVPAVSRTTHSR